MFQFGGFPSHTYLIQYTIYDSSSYVFPHSEICGSKLICSSPQLIAACHVLHRLPMPRHSPYALLSLNYFCILISIYSVLVYAWIAVYHTCSLILDEVFFSSSGKIVFFYPIYGKTWFRISRLILFPFTFVCHVCHTNSFELIWIHLIRFSMNIRLTSSLSFTVTWSLIKYLWNLTIYHLLYSK